MPAKSEFLPSSQEKRRQLTVNPVIKMKMR